MFGYLVPLAISLGLATAAFAAEPVTADKILSGIGADVAASRGIAASEVVERTNFDKKKKNQTCAALLSAGIEASKGLVTWHDRLRLNVASDLNGQTFSLISPGRFEPADPSGLLRPGATSSGEYSVFLQNLMSGDANDFQPVAMQQTSLGQLAAVGFSVPASKSHWMYAAEGKGAAPIAYKGSFLASPDSGELKRLIMVAENTGDACLLQYTLDYAPVKVGDRNLILPQSSVMEGIYTDGTESRSETHYSGWNLPEAKKPAPPAPKTTPPPAGLRINAKLQTVIDGNTSAIGDAVTAVVKSDVKDKTSSTVLVHAGDRLHGRIARFEEYTLPYEKVGAVREGIDPKWQVGIVFETLESGTGTQAMEQAISLTPIDDGDQTAHDNPTTPGELAKLRPAGGAFYIVYKKTLTLDQKFETDWETR